MIFFFFICCVGGFFFFWIFMNVDEGGVKYNEEIEGRR